MRALRRHIVVQAIVCLLLTWAAADLLVPQLCTVEQAAQTDGSTAPQDRDDCFCCCSHVERTPPVEVVSAVLIPPVRETFPTPGLAPGVPRSLYHPPLLS